MSSIFDIFRERGIIREAEGDDQADAAAQPDGTADVNTDDTATDTDTAADTNTDNTDDDFNIDTSLDMDTDNSGTDGGSTDSGADTSTSGEVDNPIDGGEVNKYNTNMFITLTAEEQKIKIKELKNQYQTVYDSISEMLDRINNMDTDESNLAIISRISGALFDLRKFIGDYIIYEFPQKSFYDNDVMFNRFLLVISTLGKTLDKYNSKLEKDQEDEEK